MFSPCRGFLDVIVHRDGVCLSPVEAFLMLSYTVMVYVLSCRGFLRTQGGFLVEAFFLLSYTGMVYVLSCRGFLDVIVHRDGVCSLL